MDRWMKFNLSKEHVKETHARNELLKPFREPLQKTNPACIEPVKEHQARNQHEEPMKELYT